MTAAKKRSILDILDELEDVEEELVTVPQWGDVKILFRGMSFDALHTIQESGIDLESANKGNLDQAIRLVQATACDPATKELIFDSQRGARILRQRGYEGVMHCLTYGTNVVLGVDEAETSGKDLSSTVTETPAND